MLRISFFAAASALALGACGQQAQQAEAPPVAAPPPAAITQAQITDADFVQRVANSDAFEIQSAEIAAERSPRADVKTVAAQLRTDHTATTQELTALAPSLSMTAPTPMLDPAHTSQIEALRNASGEGFDDLYLDQQVEAHENAVQLFESYLVSAPQGQLRQWAETTLPKLRTHLDHVRGLENAT